MSQARILGNPTAGLTGCGPVKFLLLKEEGSLCRGTEDVVLAIHFNAQVGRIKHPIAQSSSLQEAHQFSVVRRASWASGVKYRPARGALRARRSSSVPESVKLTNCRKAANAARQRARVR
ncbi:hypothetical protein NDU88_002075 [Pleurodeles waltl]|uniref:Uncharacterized protein n=1 Tax=Pleurodeles waltl TaxID=8319 RepID=A0AAV7UUN2_PLEWA|nr:hypothetical protein NDU88_002075 [Pleurodeles waltl]